MNKAASLTDRYFAGRAKEKSPWQETDGLMLKGCMEMYGATRDSAWRAFVLSFMEASVSPEGKLLYFPEEGRDLRPVCCGPALFFAFNETGGERYRAAIVALAEWLKAQPRCACGSYWSRETAPNQLRLDALYFAQPFQVLFDVRLGDKRLIKDTAMQFQNARDQLFDAEKRLYRTALPHPAPFSLRAAGLHLAALVDCLENADIQLYEHYIALADLFLEAVRGLLPYRGKETRLFSGNIIDGDKSVDAGACCLIVYALFKGVSLGLLDEEKYLPVAEDARKALASRAEQMEEPAFFGPWLMVQAYGKEA